MNWVTTIQELAPEEAAEQIFAAHGHEGVWLDAFTESLDRRRASRSFARTIGGVGSEPGRGGAPLRREPPGNRQMAVSRYPAGAGEGHHGSGRRYRSACALSRARPNPRGCAQAHPGARRSFSGGFAGTGRHTDVAHDVPRHVPIRTCVNGSGAQVLRPVVRIRTQRSDAHRRLSHVWLWRCHSRRPVAVRDDCHRRRPPQSGVASVPAPNACRT